MTAAVAHGMLVIRAAILADIGIVVDFVRELADYEKLLHEVNFEPAQYKQHMFLDPPYAKPEVLIAELVESVSSVATPVGFALYVRWTSDILHLEDLFVSPLARGKGAGIALLSKLATIAIETGGSELRWNCLAWNEPSIKFYRSIGAVLIEDRIVYRLEGNSLRNGSELMYTQDGFTEREFIAESNFEVWKYSRMTHLSDGSQELPLITVKTTLSFTTFLATPVLVVMDIVYDDAQGTRGFAPLVDALRREAIGNNYSRVDFIISKSNNALFANFLAGEFRATVLSEWVAFTLSEESLTQLAQRSSKL